MNTEVYGAIVDLHTNEELFWSGDALEDMLNDLKQLVGNVQC